MAMKWILIGSIGIMIASCTSKTGNEKVLEEFKHEGALAYCECVFADTSGLINIDSCRSQTMKKLDEKKKNESRFAVLDTMEFEIYFEPDEMEKVCPGWKDLMANKLEETATKLAKEKSYLPTPEGDEFTGTLLSWEKLPQGEKEYEIVVRSAMDSTTRTFITQARPPAGGDPGIIYVTFEPNEAAYHEKYPFRAVQVRFTNKK